MIVNNRTEIALTNLFKKFGAAKNATDICKAISELKNDNLRDNERYSIYLFLRVELPEYFVLYKDDKRDCLADFQKEG